MTAMASESKSTVGELLRQGRLRQRLSIAECAKRTHIAVRYIEALEEEKWADLPSESHRLGFLRLYLRFLGVPAEEALAQYHRSVAAAAGSPAAAHPDSAAHRPERSSRDLSTWSPKSIP